MEVLVIKDCYLTQIEIYWDSIKENLVQVTNEQCNILKNSKCTCTLNKWKFMYVSDLNIQNLSRTDSWFISERCSEEQTTVTNLVNY